MAAIFVGVMASLAVAVSICILIIKGIIAFDDSLLIGSAWLVAAAIVLSGFIAVAVTLIAGEDDPRLCLRGHQQYVNSYTPPMLVGKVFVPGGMATHKVWVCDQWSER